MAKKYEFTGETKVWVGRTLHRIRALISFGEVKAGELGGWIEKEENLSHVGSAWVYEEAMVSEEAKVLEDARVSGRAWVAGRARVLGRARVAGRARVVGTARVGGAAKVCGNASIRKTSHYLNIGPIGSRLDFTTFFRTEGNQIYVKCGCFSGDIEEFAAAVQATHGNNQHAKAYMAAIELAKMQIDLTGEDSEVPKSENDNG